jgi:peptidoglycan hydrolase-like protein with peptidoglycan-binding domain
METLAYIHLAVVNESPENTELTADISLGWIENLNWKKLPSSAWIRLGALALSVSILSIASGALALQRGDSGSQVTALQQNLAKAGFYSSSVTGFYGQLTEASVLKFQQAKGLPADGIAGSNTLAALASTQVKSSVPSGTLLRRGSSGTLVSKLQSALTAARYYNGPITGYYGQLTEASVIRFQQAKGLPADGIAGASTWSALGVSNNDGGGQSQGILKVGSSGSAVTQVQNRLKALGIYNGPITAYYSRLTEAAVRDFQRSRGITVNGLVGPTTWSALQKATPNNGSSGTIAPLQRGSSGPRVRSLQTRLIGLGYYTGAKDGIFGPGTEAALKRYQQDKGLVANGIAEASTFASLAPRA